MGNHLDEAPATPISRSSYTSHRQTIPIAEELDTPPPYEPQPSSPTTSPAVPTPTSGASSTYAGSEPRRQQQHAPQRPGSQASSVSSVGYKAPEPMAAAPSELAMKEWNRDAGCCFSDSGGCCFSSHGACCFSDNGACCFSDHGACCFSDNGGCCFSNNGGCCCC